MRHPAQPLALVLAAALAAGCASTPATPEAQVQQRANAYWQARATGDVKTAYSLLPPAYRQLRTQQDFVRQNGPAIAVVKAEVPTVTCESAEKCNARVALTGKLPLQITSAAPVTNYMDDTWVLEEGQWWHYIAP